MVDNCRVAESKTEFTVHCGGFGRGIYIREPLELEKPSVVAVTIEPVHYDGIVGKKGFTMSAHVYSGDTLFLSKCVCFYACLS